MSPLWQLKQTVSIEGERYVDRNLAFRSSASAAIFISFNSLVAWIAKYVKGLDYLSNYVDDSSGCASSDSMRLYEPYSKYLLEPQVRLLLLWDELGILHKPHKQIFGCPLPIIGIEVDSNKMTLMLLESAKLRLIDELRYWTKKPPKTSSGSFKLKHWERLVGWFNWALNVFPLLRPALNNIYSKMGGKQNKEQRVYINNAIRDDLSWALTHLENSDGIHLFKSISWTPLQADCTVYCD